MLVAFLATGPRPMRHLVALGALSLLCLPLLLTPAGQTALDHLPIVGSVDSQNVTYRQKLLEISSAVIMQRPWFGAFDFYLLPEMQELKQGQGIIDVVNTYLNVGLERGLTGLFLFTGFFIAIAAGLYRAMRSLDDHDGEVYLLGQTLLATLLGVMLIIFTVSSISVVAVVYWSIAGACAAYIRMVAMEQRSAAPAPAAMPQPALRAGVAR
jgi:O-antigen ligase